LPDSIPLRLETLDHGMQSGAPSTISLDAFPCYFSVQPKLRAAFATI
jgi:hypothetical protein